MQIEAHRPEIPVVLRGNPRSHDFKFDKGTIYIVYFHTHVHVHTCIEKMGNFIKI